MVRVDSKKLDTKKLMLFVIQVCKIKNACFIQTLILNPMVVIRLPFVADEAIV